jgi:CNT family concentrative nucleoside transporter
MLLVFTAFIAMTNGLLGWIAGPHSIAWLGWEWTGINELIASSTEGRYTSLSLEYMLGKIFAPLAWLLGIDAGSLTIAGQLIGEKTILNEFYAYGTLGKVISQGLLPDPRAQIILTYALCGFANIASIGIQIGGIGVLAPNKRPILAQLGVKSLIGGSLCTFIGAAIAGALT